MTRRYLTAAGLAGMFLLGLLAGGSPPAAGQDKQDQPAAGAIEKANAEADTVRIISLATELARNGEDQKSALQLLTAATLFRQAKVLPSKTKPKVELPEGLAPSDEDDKELPPLGMQARADELFKKAADIARDNKDDLLLKLIEDTNKQGATTRGGTPRTYTRSIRQGVTHTYNVTMVPGSHCTAAVTGNGKNSFTITVTGAAGVRQGSYTGANPSIGWNAGRQPRWTVQVTNNGPGPGAYTLCHN